MKSSFCSFGTVFVFTFKVPIKIYFNFQNVQTHPSTPLWHSGREELRSIWRILPLLRASISDHVCPTICYFDACLSGYAVTRNRCCDPSGALQYHERWRFKTETSISVSARAHALVSDVLENPFACNSVRSTLPEDVGRETIISNDFQKFRWRSATSPSGA